MNIFKEYTLAEYISEQGTNFGSSLPLVHSTEGSNLLSILGNGVIETIPCDTFTDEKLSYFFHGRPSYRKFVNEPKFWQLPVVMVFKSTCLVNKTRIFPFDSGALYSNRLPKYISSFSPDGYQLSSKSDCLDLLIDIFFGDDASYFAGRAKPYDQVVGRRKFGVRHAQVAALCSLYNREQLEADDRALAIEIQTDQDVQIKDNLIGAVLPRPYYDDPELKKYFRENRIIVKHYDIYPLSVEAYMSLIYSNVKELYMKWGLIGD
ncbi:hypothetical protein [uncultured Hoeflea sp.]|uniref:hypothetical protein n=1 Tax=uncultured Hoeflea sp. TaxID=538666 RepID=UPI0026142CEB|nr:hypothetical protein [uncultured Hoeflea sp.]